MKKTVFLLLSLLAFVMTATAQIKGNEIRVVVSPDHPDWNYRLNEPCTFTIGVYKAQELLPGVKIDYETGPVLFPDKKAEGVVLKDGRLRLKGTMSKPGYYRCKVRAHVKGYTYEGLATAAYAPEKIEASTQLPADFGDFWKQRIAEARQTPLDARMTLLPERCTDKVNVYEVNFQNDAWGSRIYGILSMPKAAGRYPALLRVPGAGVRPYTGDSYTASKGAITLEIGIHGIPVTMNQEVYDRLAGGALRDYYRYNLDDAQTFYYRRVVLGVIRSIDFIDQLPEFDHKTLGVTGSSQGGALSVMAAALDSRVTFYAAIHPALCDHEAFLKGRAGGWPCYFQDSRQATADKIRTARYYDTANFARCLKVPGWFSWGYNDEVCAPTSMQAAYNAITAPKEFHPYLETGHYWYQEQYDEWNAWLFKMLAAQPAAATAMEVPAAKLTVPAANLIRNIAAMQGKGCMFGHHDDTVYGIGWENEEGRSDVKSVCGDYPAIVSFDLGGIELGQQKSLDSVAFDKIRREAVRQYERGGIVSMSWHLRNPLTGGDAWDTSDDGVVKSVLPGGSRHEAFMGWLERLSAFLNSVKTTGGQKIPLLFRPWHEHTGSWFWWGAKHCSADDYKTLWRMTVKYLREHGGDNLLFCYSTGTEPQTAAQYLERYPGDDCIDVLGFDAYQYGSDSDFSKDLDRMLTITEEAGRGHNKPVAVTETGSEALPDATWWTGTLLPVLKKHHPAWVLVWRNAREKQNHFYAPYPGQRSAADFRAFYDDPFTRFAKDIKGIYKK